MAKIDDYVITKFTIEHILPDSASDSSVCYIGNLIPLVKRINKTLKNAPVNEKVKKYSDANFSSVKEFVGAYNNTNIWNAETIKTRTLSMANKFWKEIWIKK